MYHIVFLTFLLSFNHYLNLAYIQVFQCSYATSVSRWPCIEIFYFDICCFCLYYQGNQIQIHVRRVKCPTEALQAFCTCMNGSVRKEKMGKTEWLPGFQKTWISSTKIWIDSLFSTYFDHSKLIFIRVLCCTTSLIWIFYNVCLVCFWMKLILFNKFILLKNMHYIKKDPGQCSCAAHYSEQNEGWTI